MKLDLTPRLRTKARVVEEPRMPLEEPKDVLISLDRAAVVLELRTKLVSADLRLPEGGRNENDEGTHAHC